MKNLFVHIETTINIKLGSILKKLTQRNNRRVQAHLDDCDNDTCTSTQFWQTQKKQLIDLQELWKVIAMFYLSLVSTAQNMIST